MKTKFTFLFSAILLSFFFFSIRKGNGYAFAQTIAAGARHTAALCNDNTVRAWGENVYGALGDNTIINKLTPIQVLGPGGVGFLTGITAIAAGQHHTLAIKNDLTVWTWGRNGDGQLGDNTIINKLTTVQVLGPGGAGFLTGITSVAGGWLHSLALKNDGTVWAWGRNQYGQLGDPAAPGLTPSQVLGPGGVGFLTNVIAIAGGGISHSVALKNDGTVWAWGRGLSGQLGDNLATNSWTPVQVLGPGAIGFLNGIIAIGAGELHSFAIKNDGTVWTWGANGAGQLGDNTTTQRNTPVQVLGPGAVGFLNGITTIAGGDGHSLALKNDGTVWAWGSNVLGQLGDNTTTVKLTPVQVLGPGAVGFLNGITSIVAGEVNSVALKNDGTVWACGYNVRGQLGDNTTIDRWAPVQSSPLCTVTLLPIELLSFTAECLPVQAGKNNTVELNWSTATETNNDYFTMERTLNGFNYQVIGTVKGVGNSSTTQYYSLTDNEPLPGIAYYRLKQTDYDGQYEYFQLVPVSCGKGIDIISIYPNPAIGDINIIVSSSELTGVTINLIDVLSRKVISNTAYAKQGNNTFSLDVSTLSSGSYSLQVVTESGLYRTQKQFVVK